MIVTYRHYRTISHFPHPTAQRQQLMETPYILAAFLLSVPSLPSEAGNPKLA